MKIMVISGAVTTMMLVMLTIVVISGDGYGHQLSGQGHDAGIGHDRGYQLSNQGHDAGDGHSYQCFTEMVTIVLASGHGSGHARLWSQS